MQDVIARYEEQLVTVETYVIETDMYTSYNRKVMKDGAPTYETKTVLKGQPALGNGMQAPSSFAQLDMFRKIGEHGTYRGTETVDGRTAHVIDVDNPQAVTPDMPPQVEAMTYYVDAAMNVPVRMTITSNAGQGSAPGTMDITFSEYQTTEGLTVPHRMTFDMNLGQNMTPEQKQQMQQMMERMKNMPDEQRKQMQQMMGDRFEMMQKMLNDEPIVITVQRVSVNEPIDASVFGNGRS